MHIKLVYNMENTAIYLTIYVQADDFRLQFHSYYIIRIHI